MPNRKKLFRAFFFQVFVVFLFFVLPVCLSAETPHRNPSISKETSQDVYFQTEGVVSGPPAPKLKIDDYPYFRFLDAIQGSRVAVWSIAQQHLYFGGLVLGSCFWSPFLNRSGHFRREKILPDGMIGWRMRCSG